MYGIDEVFVRDKKLATRLVYGLETKCYEVFVRR